MDGLNGITVPKHVMTPIPKDSLKGANVIGWEEIKKRIVALANPETTPTANMGLVDNTDMVMEDQDSIDLPMKDGLVMIDTCAKKSNDVAACYDKPYMSLRYRALDTTRIYAKN